MSRLGSYKVVKIIVHPFKYQVNALRDYYSKLVTTRTERLKLVDHVRHVIIPRIAVGFIVCYWIIGLAKYSDPDLTMSFVIDFFTSPLVLAGLTLLFIMVLLMFLVKKACCSK